MNEPSINRVKYKLPPQQYMPDLRHPTQIVLHFTAGGNAGGAVDGWLKTAERVATPYVIDRDGKIYETHPPEGWAWHLGGGVDLKCSQMRAADINRNALGVEIVNVGPVRKRGTDMRWWPPVDKRTGLATFNTLWCAEGDVDRYVYVPDGWRGESYFATYTAAQVDSVKRLVRWLGTMFEIPMAMPEGWELPKAADPARAAAHRGVLGHHHFVTGKTDPGPAWDWSWI